MAHRTGKSVALGGVILLLVAGPSITVFAQDPAQQPLIVVPPSTGQTPVYTPLPGFGQPPGLGPQPGYGQPPLPVQPLPGQPPAAGEQKPVAPGTPPPTSVPVLVPVIPDVQPAGPPTTVPSAPQRLVVAPGTGPTPTATLQFEPNVTVLEEYTDNFNLTKTNKQENFRSTVSPGFRLGINSPLIKGLIAYTFAPAYDTATKDVSLFHSILGQVVYQVNPRWQVTLADSYIQSDQPGEADRLGLRQGRRSFSSNTFSATSEYLIDLVTTKQSYRLINFSDDDGGKTTTHEVAAGASLPIYQTNVVSAGYDYVTTDSTEGTGTGTGIQSTTAGREFNVSGHQFTVSGSRRLSALTTVGLKGSYAFRTITGDSSTSTTTTSTTSDETDYRLWTASLFTSYTLPGRLTLAGSVGMTALSADRGISIGPNFFSASSLTYQFVRTTITLTGDKGFSETFADGDNFGVVETEGVTAAVTYRFTPSVTATVSGSYRKNKFTGIGGTASTRNEDTKNWGGSALVSWRILRWLLLDLSYTYFEQTTAGSDSASTTGTTTGLNEFDNRNYAENRVQAAFRFNF